jgi:hypothetical protein
MISTHLGHVEGNLHVTHRTEVEDLVGLHIGNDGDEVGGVTKVAVVKEKLHSGLVTVAVDVIDAARVKGG